jgi:hypothetical protein
MSLWLESRHSRQIVVSEGAGTNRRWLWCSGGTILSAIGCLTRCEEETQMVDLIAAITEAKAAKTFASAFVGGYLMPAFGARSKSEIDLLVFSCLIEAGVVDPTAPIYDIARAFNLSPARVRTLLFNWQLRSTAASVDLRESLVVALRLTRFAKDGTLLTFGVESPLLREEIVARLKRRGVFADSTFTREIVRLPVDAFVEFLDDVVDEGTTRELRKILLKDKQLPDRSFKALATGVLSKLGEKVAGKAGEAVAGALVEGASEAVIRPAAERLEIFLSGLLAGDAAAAASPIGDDDVDVA